MANRPCQDNSQTLVVFYVDKETVLRAEQRQNPPQPSRLCHIASYINR